MVSQCESYYLRDTEIRVNLKPCVLESMKYGANGCIFSALDSSEKKSSCLWYYWFLMYSFFQSLFSFHKWIPITFTAGLQISPWKPCCWLKSLWVDQIPSLLTAPEWTSSNPPKSTSLANQKPPSVCPAALDSTPPLSCWLPEKPRKSPGRKEASVCLWKRTICVSGKFYNSCAAKHVHSKAEQPPSPRSCRPRDYSILLKRKKAKKCKAPLSFLLSFFSSLSLSSLCREMVNCFVKT